MFLKYLIALAILIVAVSATDYCNPGLCRPGVPHIGCKNNGKLSSSCPSNAQFFNMSKLKNSIIKAHNEKRNQVAGGLIPKHSSAVRMATIQWDDELAYLAGLNVKTCKYGHDQCRNTDTFKFSGQNIAKNWWQGMNQNISVLIQQNIQNWFNEYKDSDMTKINKVTDQKKPVVGHFTAMVHELANRVGCAAVKSWEVDERGRWDTLTFACNYAHTNVLGHKIYRSGPAASQCTSGKNKIFGNLCSVREVYNHNVPLK